MYIYTYLIFYFIKPVARIFPILKQFVFRDCVSPSEFKKFCAQNSCCCGFAIFTTVIELQVLIRILFNEELVVAVFEILFFRNLSNIKKKSYRFQKKALVSNQLASFTGTGQFGVRDLNVLYGNVL